MWGMDPTNFKRLWTDLDDSAGRLETQARKVRDRMAVEVFRLHDRTRMSYADIASIVGLSKPRVQQLVNKGRELDDEFV